MLSLAASQHSTGFVPDKWREAATALDSGNLPAVPRVLTGIWNPRKGTILHETADRGGNDAIAGRSSPVAKWSGWWEQRGLGRQEMRNLVLNVDPAGELSGSGDDCVGSFTIAGNLSAEVRLVKRYVRRHSLLYVGTNSGEGIFGIWQVPGAPAIPGLTSGKIRPVPIRDFTSDRTVVRELKPAGCR